MKSTGTGKDDGRRPIVAANWKMHLSSTEARAWVRSFRAERNESSSGRPDAPDRAEVILFPGFTLLAAVQEELSGPGSGDILLGGQDVHPAERGAHTGDVSALQLADAGCSWALCGHSERRRDHSETNELVGRKVAAARQAGLKALLCVGETREERLGGQMEAVLEGQLREALGTAGTAGVTLDPESWAVAYEPVWAIGTGETATPQQAEKAHSFTRGVLADLVGPGPADQLRILYGGSVTPANAAELASGPNVDGFLVGGASLDPGRFLAIIRGCSPRS